MSTNTRLAEVNTYLLKLKEAWEWRKRCYERCEEGGHDGGDVYEAQEADKQIEELLEKIP